MEIKDLSFEEAMEELESKIAQLEEEGNQNNQQLYNEAIVLKDHCATLLEKEKEEIKRVAKENDIPLSDIGLVDED
jgi:exonuclease VII small subunit